MTLAAPAGLDKLELTDIEARPPGPGEIQVEVKASSLNFHDYVVVTGLLPVENGRIPMSDGAGIVTAVGEGVDDFKEGDRVLSHFFPQWQDGPATLQKIQGIPGDNVDGFASRSATMPTAAPGTGCWCRAAVVSRSSPCSLPG
jgi:NADPH:quinone reductase-like Zn-dependent oxidoreductase